MALKDGSTRKTFIISNKILGSLERIADSDGNSMSAVIRQALAEYVRKRETEKYFGSETDQI